MTLAPEWICVLAAGLGRGASGHHTGLYFAASAVIVLIALGAAMLRNRRR